MVKVTLPGTNEVLEFGQGESINIDATGALIIKGASEGQYKTGREIAIFGAGQWKWASMVDPKKHAAAAQRPNRRGGGTSPAASSSSDAPVTIRVVADPNTVGAFNPKDATAKVGDTVLWSFDDPLNSHTATSDSGDPADFDSGALSQGQTFTFTFTKPGKYTYHCSLHSQMTGSITVS